MKRTGTGNSELTHDHLDASEAEPVTAVRRLQDQLDDFSGVEVPADEFRVRRVFFEGRDGEMVGLHDRMAYCGDPFEEVLRELRVRTG